MPWAPPPPAPAPPPVPGHRGFCSPAQLARLSSRTGACSSGLAAPRAPCQDGRPDPPPALCALSTGAGAVLALPWPRAAAGRWPGARRAPCPWDGGRPSPCSALRTRRDGAPRGRLQPHPVMPLGRIKENYSHARRHEPHARPSRQPGHSHSNSTVPRGQSAPVPPADGRDLLPALGAAGSPRHSCRHRARAEGPPCHKSPARQGAPREASPGRTLCRCPEHPQPAPDIPDLPSASLRCSEHPQPALSIPNLL